MRPQVGEHCVKDTKEERRRTHYFNIEVGLHQGSTLSPLLFIIIMNVIASTIQRDPPWAMLYADDLVIYEETILEVEQQLDSWREVLEGNGLRISRRRRRRRTLFNPKSANVQCITYHI